MSVAYTRKQPDVSYIEEEEEEDVRRVGRQG